MSTTDGRPADTIRDAFEAMLWYLACLIGPLRPRKITPAEEVGALAACEVETDFEPDDPPAPLLAFRDLIQRAAEEHNRRAAAGAFTPERMREARERCSKATPGPWHRKLDSNEQENIHADDGEFVDAHWIALIPHQCVAHIEQQRAHDAAFIAHAREDLPAALSEIERLTSDVATLELKLADAQGEHGRLTAELAARAPADHLECPYCHAEIESTAGDAERVRCPECGQFSGVLVESGKRYLAGFDDAADRAPAPADASLEARAAGRRMAIILPHIQAAARDAAQSIPGGRVLLAIIAKAADGSGRITCDFESTEFLADLETLVRAVDASRPAAPVIDAEDLWTDYRTGRGTVFASDRKAFLAGVAAGRRTVDASRPGLTEEQARAAVSALAGREMTTEEANGDFDGLSGRDLWDAGYDCALKEADAALLRASRGETGPAPAGLTRAMHDAQQRPSTPPDLGPGIGSAPIRVRPTTAHDPRATLHAGDPASPFAPGSLAAGSATEDRILDRKRGGK